VDAMNPMHTMNPMHSVHTMNPMHSVDAMNPMYTMYTMNPVDAVNAKYRHLSLLPERPSDCTGKWIWQRRHALACNCLTQNSR
jgi:hypothetical protein